MKRLIGWSLDHHMPKAFFEKGARNFVMLGNSRVYHFISKTFKKLPDEIKNRDGQDIFKKKWGQTVEDFRTSLNIRQEFKVTIA